LAHRKADDNGRALGSQDIAYMRATLFEERRALHEAWVAYVQNCAQVYPSSIDLIQTAQVMMSVAAPAKKKPRRSGA
jgi:hypothetical protein